MTNWKEKETEKYNWLYKEKGYAKKSDDLPYKLIREFKIGKYQRCIDIGCGRASLSNYFTEYTGVDISDYIINENRKTRKGIYIHSSIDNLDVVSNDYDVAICSDVMEHIPPQKINDVLESISKIKCNYFFFSISTRPSKILSKENENLHLSVFSNTKWKSIMNNYFKILQDSSPIPTLFNLKCVKI